MLKKTKIKILILLISIIILGGYFFISSIIGNPKYSNLKSLLNAEQKELIKKYIFPYKTISQQQQTISQQRQMIIEKDKALVLMRPHVIGIELEMKKKKTLK